MRPEHRAQLLKHSISAKVYLRPNFLRLFFFQAKSTLAPAATDAMAARMEETDPTANVAAMD